MQLYLAIHGVDGGDTDEAFKEILARVAEAAHDVGARVETTMYSLPKQRAFSILGAESEDQIRGVYERGGLPEPEIVPVKRVYTELLDEERLERVH